MAITAADHAKLASSKGAPQIARFRRAVRLTEARVGRINISRNTGNITHTRPLLDPKNAQRLSRQEGKFEFLAAVNPKDAHTHHDAERPVPDP